MLTIGTGIGGGIICNGRPYRGFSGAAGELGHMVIDVNGPRCQGNCPNYGCLEAFVSGGALAAHARRLAAARPGSAFGRAAAAGEPLDGHLVTRLAQAGDADAVAVYEELGTLLGVGITNLVNAFNPELVVVGGSVAAAGDLSAGARPPRGRRAWPAAAARPGPHRGGALRRGLRAHRRRRPGADGALRRRLSARRPAPRLSRGGGRPRSQPGRSRRPARVV